MDVSSLASALVGAQAGQLQAAIATQILRMSVQQDASVLQLLQPAPQTSGSLANVAAGIGQNLDLNA